MEDTKQLTLVGNETPEQAEAIGLHYEIVSAAQAAASSLLDLGRKLKRMRDSGKYKALGFETFGDYTEQAVHIRQRQAYTYISVVEKLPAQLIEENAAAGVTKLALLAKLGPQDREEVAGDLANITVTELQKLIDEKNDMAEQLSLLSAPPAAERLRLRMRKYTLTTNSWNVIWACKNILNTNFCHGKNLFLRCITAHTPKAAHCAGLFCLLRLDAALEKTATWPMKILHLSPP